MDSAALGGGTRPTLVPAATPEAQALRERVLAELAGVKGRVELALETTDPMQAKEQLRIAHSAQREARFKDSAEWIIQHEASMLEQFADGSEVVPALIDPVVVPVRTQAEADLFRYATLQWSVPVSAGYGRRSRFLVRDRQNGKLIAIFSLGDPVIAQGARDDAIGWDKANRNAKLYNVYDAFVLGAVEPYRQLLGGKLAALLTLSNEVRDFLTNKYSGTTTGISKVQKDPTPLLITTSSALGRSSVYNRVTFEGRLMFHSVGFTKGFGHFQFSDALFADLLQYVRNFVLADPRTKVGSAAYGSGPNWRFRVIRTALGALDIDPAYLQHNVKREVFLAPTAVGWDAYLRGEQEGFEPYDLPTEKIGAYYRDRWAVARAERMPAFRFWRREEGRLSPMLGAQQLVLGLPSSPPYGRVELGPYALAVGVSASRVVGRTASGARAEGTSYVSRLEGPDLHVEIFDTSWDTGERDVRGSDLVDGRPMVMGIDISATFRNMSAMTIKTVHRKNPAARPTYRKATVDSLSAEVGLDFQQALDRLAEATVGTRRLTLGEEGADADQLCAVFGTSDRVTPALVWSLTRAIPMARVVNPDAAPPAEPRLRRIAPSLERLEADGIEAREI